MTGHCWWASRPSTATLQGSPKPERFVAPPLRYIGWQAGVRCASREMPPRQFPTSNPGTDFDRSIDALVQRIDRLEGGQHRGPGCSFGVPFMLTNGTDVWSLGVDSSGNLIATNNETGTVTVLASP